MSRLTLTLNRIKDWMQIHHPQIAAALPAGLPLATIEEIVHPLPYRLPPEVYELYHWSSGWSEETETWEALFAPYEGMRILSPQAAMETIPDFGIECDQFKIRYLGKPLFPIFAFESEYLCVIANWEEQYPSPVVQISEINEVHLRYVSLMSLLQTSAEVWETEVVYINEQGSVECDRHKFSQIYCKYNSELPQMVLARLKQGLELAGSDERKLWHAWGDGYGDVKWLTRHWSELSVDQFAPELVEPLVREMNQKDESLYSSDAKRILAELKYKF